MLKNWPEERQQMSIALSPSGLCDLFYYTCYGHPWAAINGTAIKLRLREIKAKIIEIIHHCRCEKNVGQDGRRESGA